MTKQEIQQELLNTIHLISMKKIFKLIYPFEHNRQILHLCLWYKRLGKKMPQIKLHWIDDNF